MLRFILLLLFPLVANAATFWSFDWETLPTDRPQVGKDE